MRCKGSVAAGIRKNKVVAKLSKFAARVKASKKQTRIAASPGRCVSGPSSLAACAPRPSKKWARGVLQPSSVNCFQKVSEVEVVEAASLDISSGTKKDLSANIAHRFWIQAPGGPEADISLGVEMASLKSFHAAGYKQCFWLWVDDFEHLTRSNIVLRELAHKFPSILLKDLKEIRSLREVGFMLAHNVSPQHVKDICAFWILYLFGGVAADFKILWRGANRVDLTGAAGAIATEPCKQCPPRTRVVQRKQCGGSVSAILWLGFIASEMGASFAQKCFEALMQYWLRHAKRVHQGTWAAIDWNLPHPKWMVSAHIVHDVLKTQLQCVLLLPPLAVCALPSWGFAGWGRTTFGYPIPLLDDMSSVHCLGVAIWKRRGRFRDGWSDDSRTQIVKDLRSHASWSLDLDTSERRIFLIRQVEENLNVWCTRWSSVHSWKVCHELVAAALSMLEPVWCDPCALLVTQGIGNEWVLTEVLALFAYQWVLLETVGWKPELFEPFGGVLCNDEESCKLGKEIFCKLLHRFGFGS